VALGGLFLVLVGIVLLGMGFQFSALTFCIGATVLGYCVGASVNYTWIVWLATLVAGAVIVFLSIGRRR
jgi:hypothetical protein